MGPSTRPRAGRSVPLAGCPKRRFGVHASFRSLALGFSLGLVFPALWPASAQTPDGPKESPIQDNSFLIEEAYNQERHVVQHISTFSRMWNSKDWNYTFTQEWPA